MSVPAPEVLAGTSPAGLGRLLAGKQFERTRRHGKHLFVLAGEGPWLRFHFGMTGTLRYGSALEPGRFTRLEIAFTNGSSLQYGNQRKFGEVEPVDDPDEFIKARKLGPDALEGVKEAGVFLDIAHGRRGGIKSLLMNQSALAGIGNEYADEILFAARIAPQTAVAKLDDGELRAIHRAMQRVLRKAIEVRCNVERMPRTWLLPHRGRDGKCPVCGRALRKSTVAGRTTWWCPDDQRGAD